MTCQEVEATGDQNIVEWTIAQWSAWVHHMRKCITCRIKLPKEARRDIHTVSPERLVELVTYLQIKDRSNPEGLGSA